MNNRITPIDDIKVDIYEEARKVDSWQGSGLHTVEEAVRNAFEGSRQSNNIEDYVFLVRNLSSGTEARYRVNAGGNIHIIPEE